MPGKISELTALGAPVGAAEIEVLNNGGNFRAPTAGKFILQTITLASAGEFDFNNIPGGYKRLNIRGRIGHDGTAALGNLFFNNDTTATNYFQTTHRSNGTDWSTSEAANASVISAGGTNLSDQYADIDIWIEAYAETGVGVKRAMVTSSLIVGTGSDVRVYKCLVAHDTLTAAITRLTISSTTATQYIGTLTLYGEL